MVCRMLQGSARYDYETFDLVEPIFCWEYGLLCCSGAENVEHCGGEPEQAATRATCT